MQTKNGDGKFTLTSATVMVDSGNDSSSDDGRSGSGSTPRPAAKPTLSHGLTGMGCKPVKQTLLPPPEENKEEETRQEIENSRTSNDCNLSVLALTKVPENLPLTTLVSLSLSENELTALPEAMFDDGNCQCLVELDVNSNRLETLPASLFWLPRLRSLMLNHNGITDVPSAAKTASSPSGQAFLPALERVGLEFNSLQEFPMCFFLHCPNLMEVLLAQNERMLDQPVDLSALKTAAAAKKEAVRDGKSRITLKIDNRPRFMDQVQQENWASAVPWIDLSLHKIYPDKVLDYLFLGSMRTAQTVTVYHDCSIGYVLTVGRELEVLIEPGMKHKVLMIDDYPGADIAAVFPEAFAFIDEARAAKKGILIHCFAGLSRSVTVVAAYIMKVRSMTRDEAMALIKEARPAAQPNEGFMRALKENEQKLMNGEI